MNWAAHLHSAGGSLTVSSQDAHDHYGIWADIDTAKGAWSDGTQGWGHNTDVGLFKSDAPTTVTIKATGFGDWSNFGISIFSGMSNNAWNHHGGWNSAALPPTSSNPLGSNNLTYLIHDATVDSTNGITFNVAAGQVYSILLGGNAGPGNFGPHAGYSLSITSVPIPAAVWLFGSALAGMGVIGRRREKLATA